MLALHDNERVHGAYRKTWVVFAASGALALLFALAPLVLLVLTPVLSLPAAPVSAPLVTLVLMLWWWGVWTGAFFAFVNYYLDVFVITSERVIRIEQHGPFSRTIAELRLERVQDVTVEQHGILPTLLHYGNVRVQTAGEATAFVFRAIPHPIKVKEVVMEAHREALMRGPGPHAT